MKKVFDPQDERELGESLERVGILGIELGLGLLIDFLLLMVY